VRLADHFLAARGSLADLGGFCTYMGGAIKEAQRFEIADDVALAVHGLVDSKPSALAAALPLCRLPYPVMWIEWRGGLGPHHRDNPLAPVPTRQGVLIESMDGQAGFMTFGWIHPPSDKYADLDVEHQVNISPISIYFDWRQEANVRDIVHRAHRTIMASSRCKDDTVFAAVDVYREQFEKRYVDIPHLDNRTAKMFFTGFRPQWTKHADSQREIDAMAEIERHVCPGISPHSTGLIATIIATGADINRPDLVKQFVASWEGDVQGEGTFVECFLAMLNSKNPVVEHSHPDLSKLNKQRVRKGKAPLLDYARTRLTMSRSQARIAQAHGVDREAARQHLVRGHFKIRKSGVYWWSPFLRGDARKGAVPRQEYAVR